MLNTNNVKSLRVESNMSQSEVAQLLNVSRSSYAMWETNNDIFPIKRLIKFCEVFNVSLDYALNLTNKKIKGIYDLSLSGSRIKEFRKENNLTQEKLAQILNTNKSVICGYEKGRNIIATPFLYTICKEYNVSADYILGKTDKPQN